LPVTKVGPDDGAPVTAPKPPKPNLPAAPAAASVEHGEPLPWAMLLADGRQCTLARGATVAFAGMRVNYFCSGGGMLLGEPDRTLPVWAVLYLPDGGLETDLVGVSAVWP
jgi:hypothetical protein